MLQYSMYLHVIILICITILSRPNCILTPSPLSYFHEIWHETSVWSLVVHIITIFRFVDVLHYIWKLWSLCKVSSKSLTCRELSGPSLVVDTDVAFHYFDYWPSYHCWDSLNYKSCLDCNPTFRAWSISKSSSYCHFRIMIRCILANLSFDAGWTELVACGGSSAVPTIASSDISSETALVNFHKIWCVALGQAVDQSS